MTPCGPAAESPPPGSQLGIWKGFVDNVARADDEVDLQVLFVDMKLKNGKNNSEANKSNAGEDDKVTSLENEHYPEEDKTTFLCEGIRCFEGRSTGNW